MRIFHALSDPTRQRIVELLAARGRLRAGELVTACGASAPAVSQHLKVLREAKLVAVEPVAQARIYFLDPQGLIAAQQWITHQMAEWQLRFDALDALLRRPETPAPPAPRTRMAARTRPSKQGRTR